MKVAFLGTPDFAIPSLVGLYEAGHDIVVFTQPDKPVGRHARLTSPSVKARARRLGLLVYQFPRMRSPEAQACLEAAEPDIMVTAAFGQLLDEANLAVPRFGCINVHASLLPRFRGAAPVQNAIISGDKVTGVTIMQTELGLDTGAVLAARELQIDPDEDSASLMARLAVAGAELLCDTLPLIERGAAVAVPQNEADATFCRPIRKEQAHIDFSQSAKTVHDLVRGMSPWPAAWCVIDGENVKIWRAALTDMPAAGESGLCIASDRWKGILVNAGDSVVKILELQFPGGKRQSAEACVNGRYLYGKVFS